MSIFNPNLQCVVYTDASRDGVAGILAQQTENGEKPVAYYSKSTTKEQKNYHSFELELLAVVYTLNRFRHYLIGNPFVVITDCNAVKNSLANHSTVPRIARWILSLQDFQYETRHRPGSCMRHVDALSRNPPVKSENVEHVCEISEDDWILHAQGLDKNIKNIKEILLSGDMEGNKSIFNEYDLRGNRVYRLTAYGRKWVVPKKCRWQIVKMNHDDVGHFALEKTLQRVRQHYWFPKMRRFITKYIKCCLACLYHKAPSGRKPGYLYSIPKYAKPFHTLHLDHLGPFTRTDTGNCYLLNIVDAFTKFVFVRAVPSTRAVHVIQVLEDILTTFGNPRRIICDAGKAFTSNDFNDFCTKRHIRLFITAVGMARTNGQVERANRTILDALASCNFNKNSNCWDSNLTTVQQGINSTINKTTQYTPAELMFGIKLKMNNDLRSSDSETDHIDVTKIRADASLKLEENRIKQNVSFNRKRCGAGAFSIGDLVLTKISSHPANNNESKKLLPKYRGPFKVVEILGSDRYRVKEDIHTTRSQIPYEAVVCFENMKPVQILRQ